MKQNIWRKWNLGKEISIGSTAFFLKDLVLVYYWIMVGYYLIDPVDAYDINMKIESHAYETYVKYSAWHPEDKKIMEIANDELEHAKLQHAMTAIRLIRLHSIYLSILLVYVINSISFTL